MRILLTTTSYQDTPGPHHELLDASGHQIVRARGPLPEQDMLELVKADGGVDGILHGDDTITRQQLLVFNCGPRGRTRMRTARYS